MPLFITRDRESVSQPPGWIETFTVYCYFYNPSPFNFSFECNSAIHSLPSAPSPPERGERTGRYFQPLRTLLLPRFSHGRPCVEIRAPARENARKYDLVKYRGERDNSIFHAPNASSMLTRYLAPHKRSSVVCGLFKKREKKLRGTVFLSRIYRLFIFLSLYYSLSLFSFF